jgi:hypothetical protein
MRYLFRRCGPIWLTFAAAHLVAAVRDRPEDCHALAWRRGTEIATDVVWPRSPAVSRPGAKAGLCMAPAKHRIEEGLDQRVAGAARCGSLTRPARAETVR